MKLQILTLATKLMVLSPATSQLDLLASYLFGLARYDSDYDVRDRARFLNALLRGIRLEKSAMMVNGDESDSDEDVGGVTLRREQVKHILFVDRNVAANAEGPFSDFQIGSTSRATQRKLKNYAALPDWTEDPTDSSLRDSDTPQPANIPPSPAPRTPTHAIPSAPMGLPPRAISALESPMEASPAGSIPTQGKSKFRDLDAFLNSETEEETEEEETDECVPQP